MALREAAPEPPSSGPPSEFELYRLPVVLWQPASWGGQLQELIMDAGPVSGPNGRGDWLRRTGTTRSTTLRMEQFGKTH